MKHYYDFVCSSGHVHEALVEADQIDQARACPFGGCSMPANQVYLSCPGMHGFESKSVMADRMIYQTHNKISRGVSSDGSVSWSAVSESDQCTCGNCASHRRRESVTGVAKEGRDLNAYTA